ncbi:MAG: hypothetical protein JST80_07485 [Bdellovibrionales bacterium]|nr:hypothetical protein [Bdellovibrionales bacterium]
MNNGTRGSVGTTASSGGRGSVASPTVNVSRTTVSSYSRGGRDNVTYIDRSSGRTVLHEEYSRDRSSVTRTFYDRNNNQRSYNYNRVVYHNTYVYVYQPVYVYSGYSHWYSPFCGHDYYYNTYYHRPWAYTWSWYNDPWYDYYYRHHYYHYRPYAQYVYPSQWLVDYYWSSILADQYQDDYDNGVIAQQQSTINAQAAAIQAQQSTIDAQQAEIDLLKNQIQAQIDAELNARQNGSTITLDTKLLDASHVYVMSDSMTLVTADSDAITCNLTSGDVISLSKEGVNATGSTATMLVRSAKFGNCKAGAKVLVSIEQLQEFENEFNRRLDDGAEKMKTDPTASSILTQMQ